MPNDFPGAEKFIPPDARSLKRLREAVQLCRGCGLYRDATQADDRQAAYRDFLRDLKVAFNSR